MKQYKLLFVGILFPVLLAGCANSVQNSQPERPNILFIAVDDMNDWVGFLGGHPEMNIKTPNLDQFAESSFTFTNAHTPAPACAPARASIMTGVHHARSGAENVYWGDGPRWREIEALQDVETIEQFFKNRGYATYGGGKIYHSQAPPWTPTSQVEPENWDFYYPSPYISHPHQIRPPDEVIYPEGVDNESRPGGMPGYWTWGPIDSGDEKMADYHVVDWASHELSREHKNPFFLAAGTWKPHDPWEVPQKYFDMYPLEDIVLPEHKKDDLIDAFDHGRRNIQKWVLENEQWKKVIQAYAASITFADAMVGKLLDALEQSEYADNTIVVLWSDHGMHMGEKENIEKFTLWESSTRVPFIINVPGVTQPGSRSHQPVSLIDIYPTLAELAGFEIPSHTDGNSLVPLINAPNAKSDPVVTSYRISPNESWHIGPMFDPEIGHAVRSEHFRYIYYTGTGFEELYDHRTDPDEWNNIAYKKENKEIVQRHRNVLLELLPELTWDDNKDPDGYEVKENGSVVKKNYMPMSDLIDR